MWGSFSLSLNVHTFLLWQASLLCEQTCELFETQLGDCVFWFHSDEEEALGEWVNLHNVGKYFWSFNYYSGERERERERERESFFVFIWKFWDIILIKWSWSQKIKLCGQLHEQNSFHVTCGIIMLGFLKLSAKWEIVLRESFRLKDSCLARKSLKQGLGVTFLSCCFYSWAHFRIGS